MKNIKETILLVEDDPIHISLIKKELQHLDESIVVETVSTAKECYARLTKKNIYSLNINY